VKPFYTEEYLRDEYYRDHQFAVDLIEIHLSGGALYLASGAIDIDFDSDTAPDAGTNTYSAQGQFLGYTPINEDFDVRVGKFTINLSGLPAGYIDKFVGQEPEGSTVVVHKVFLDLTTHEGEIFNVNIQETDSTCSITVDVSSVFADFERRAGRKTADWSNWLFQGEKYDTAFEKAGFVGNTEFLWGRDS
jgi:hypothetical protein